MYGRQAGPNQGQQMLRRHRNLTPYARLLQWNVRRGWDSACSQFIIAIIIQDVCAHTRAISHGVQSLKEDIVLSTPAEQFTTMHSFMQGGCCPQQIPLSVQPQCCQTESSGRGLTVCLFWWFLFVGISIFRLRSRKQTLLLQRQRRWIGQCLQGSAAKTICGGDDISGWDFCECNFKYTTLNFPVYKWAMEGKSCQWESLEEITFKIHTFLGRKTFTLSFN